MTFIPHISVTTKPGHDDASVKVTFVKDVIASHETPFGSISDEREVGELAEVSADTAHEVAKLLHRTMEMDAELRGEHAKTEAQEMESYLGKKEGLEDQIDDLHEQLASATAEPHDLEAHLADHRALIEQQRKEINWYRGVADLLSINSWKLCPACYAEYQDGKEVMGCSTCGGAGLVTPVREGVLEKLSAAKIEELRQKREAGVPLVVREGTRDHIFTSGVSSEKKEEAKAFIQRWIQAGSPVDTCPYCNGSGEVQASGHGYAGMPCECPECFGSGKVPGIGDVSGHKLGESAWGRVKEPPVQVGINPAASSTPLSGVFSRLTDRARKAIAFATEDLKQVESPAMTTVNVLRGIARAGDNSVAMTAFANCGISVKEVSELNAAPDSENDGGYTPTCRRALLKASEIATQIGHPYIGVEHLLLGICHEAPTYLRFFLDEHRIGVKDLIQEVYSLLGVEPPK